VSEQNGNGERPPGEPARPQATRRTDRTDAPLYLARYQERQRRGGGGPAGDGASEPADPADAGTPLYLRRFRARGIDPDLAGPPVSFEGHQLAHTRAWAEITRTKELPDSGHLLAPDTVASVHLVRHGETQGYSTESGLTPLGSWQAHRRGFDLSKSVREGENVRLVCADTNRARQTAEHLRRGLLDGLSQWNRDAEVSGIVPMPEFLNFQVATPNGLRDVTSAFREYLETLERHERLAHGDRPLWMVEVDRFWTTQQGGADPIHLWLTIPLLHFEPPASCVRRFWLGIRRAVAEAQGGKVIVATHSGPIRAFATWAVGYDPGEPYNTEEVLVRLHAGGTHASVAYRNRVQDVLVPDPALLPDWTAAATAAPPADTLAEVAP
jgi:broad specificity phosphatase PhoE